MKRKASEEPDSKSSKRQILNDGGIQNRFKAGLFDQQVLDNFIAEYAESKP